MKSLRVSEKVHEMLVNIQEGRSMNATILYLLDVEADTETEDLLDNHEKRISRLEEVVNGQY